MENCLKILKKHVGRLSLTEENDYTIIRVSNFSTIDKQ